MFVARVLLREDMSLMSVTSVVFPENVVDESSGEVCRNRRREPMYIFAKKMVQNGQSTNFELNSR